MGVGVVEEVADWQGVVIECEKVEQEYGPVAKCSDVSFESCRPQIATLFVCGL